MPRRQAAVSLELNDEENNSPAGSKTCGPSTPDRTHRGTGLSQDTKSEPETSLANEDTNIESEKEIPGAFTSGNKATAEERSDVSRTCNSCVNSKALLFPSMLIDGTDSFKLSMKQTLLPVPVARIMTYACLVTSG